MRRRTELQMTQTFPTWNTATSLGQVKGRKMQPRVCYSPRLGGPAYPRYRATDRFLTEVEAFKSQLVGKALEIV